MLQDALGSALTVYLFVFPAFVLPVIVGPLVLWLFRSDELTRLAALFTLKPLLATYLWAFLYFLGDQGLSLPPSLSRLLALLPGIILTVLILWGGRRFFRSEASTILLFLLADALRWINSFLFLLGTGFDGWYDPGPNYVIGLVLPNLYALMVLVVLWLRSRRREKLAREALDRLQA